MANSMHMTSDMGTVEVLTPTPIFEGVSIGTAAEPTATAKEVVNVLEYDCFCNFSVLTCARNGLLSLFIVFLGFLFLMRIYNVHRHNHRYYHQMFVYSIAVIECILVTVHWVYMHMIQVEAIVQYLRLVQLLVICHFYLSRATRLLRWERSKIFLLIAMGLFFIYFTSIVIVTIIAASKRQTTTLMSCRDPFWLFLSIAECVLVQMFLLSGFYITKRMNQVVTLESSRRSQIFDLWSIICAFEVASIASLVYDIVMLTEANGSNCSDVYNSNELIYSVVYIFLMIFTIFIPLLTLLLVFHPIDRETDENRPLLPSRSVFQPSFLSRADHQRIYRVGRRLSYSESSIQAPPQSGGQYRKSNSYPRLPIIVEEVPDYMESI